MKKIFTLVTMALMALAVNATTFTDNLVVTIGEGGAPMNSSNTTIVVDEVANSDGLYNITLKDFSFLGFNIGDINLENVKGNSDTDGNVSFETAHTTLSIPFVGNADVTLNAGSGSVMREGKLLLNLSIVANVMGTPMDITAEYGIARYKEDMLVRMGGEDQSKAPTPITVTKQADGKYTLTLENFNMGSIPVGTIELTDIEMTESEGVKSFSYNGNITIAIIPTPIPLSLEGTMTDAALNFTITIESFGVEVYYGEESIAAGITNVTTPNASGVDEIYDLSGRKLNSLQKGINIVRKADGTTVKVLNK